MINPDNFRNVFGKTWVDRQSAPVLSIGKRKFTRYELVSRVGVGNFRAVTLLMDAIQRLGIDSIEDLKGLNPVALAAIKGVGTTTLFVAMSLLDAEGTDVTHWYADSRTFQALKHEAERQKADARREQRAAVRRRRTIEKPKRRYGLRELVHDQP